jgi:transketolase
MPSWELFENQELDYKLSVLPDGIPVLSLEAMSTFGWDKYAHASIGMTTFGASAPAKDLMVKFGFTTQNIGNKIKSLIQFSSGKQMESKIKKPW